MRSLFETLQTALKPLKNAYEHFNQVLVEGHYGADQPSIWSLLLSKSKDEADAPPLMAGNKMFKMSSSMLSKKYVIPPVIAVLSLQLQMAAVAVIGLMGAGLLTFEYMRCLRLREEVITEINMAGQTVRGTRADLSRLHRAQASIMNLASSFRPASVENTSDTLSDILNTVEAERKRVQVLDSGHYDAGLAFYNFSRQSLELVVLGEHRLTGGRSVPVSEPLPRPGYLKEAFANPLSAEDVVNRMLALESALPDDLRSKFRRQLSAKPLPATTPPANHRERQIAAA